MLRSMLVAGILALAARTAAAAGGDVREPGSAVPQPMIASVAPASAAPGDRVTITGLQFMPGARVWLGGAEATDVQVETGERLTLTVPDHEPGAASVMIRDPDGRTVSRARTFTYVQR